MLDSTAPRARKASCESGSEALAESAPGKDASFRAHPG